MDIDEQCRITKQIHFYARHPGLLDPPPDWWFDIQIARYMRLSLEEVGALPPYWRERLVLAWLTDTSAAKPWGDAPAPAPDQRQYATFYGTADYGSRQIRLS